MILIADSGSTKCDWALTDRTGKIEQRFETIGFNPFFHSSEQIEKEIRQNAGLLHAAEKISAIYYYGAGNSSKENNAIVKAALQLVFPMAKITVDHDLMGAAYATYSGEPCISCILGTGSNSCFFDGKTVYNGVPALGYVLGDEASGAYFGKKLVAAYLYNKLPAAVSKELEQDYNAGKAEIFEHVYRKPDANRYLAGFAPFLSRHQQLPVIHDILTHGLAEFVEAHILCFENAHSVPVHFVGSIAFYFKEILQQVFDDYGLRLGNIVQQPIDGMVMYHARYIFPLL